MKQFKKKKKSISSLIFVILTVHSIYPKILQIDSLIEIGLCSYNFLNVCKKCTVYYVKQHNQETCRFNLNEDR